MDTQETALSQHLAQQSEATSLTPGMEAFVVRGIGFPGCILNSCSSGFCVMGELTEEEEEEQLNGFSRSVTHRSMGGDGGRLTAEEMKLIKVRSGMGVRSVQR